MNEEDEVHTLSLWPNPQRVVEKTFANKTGLPSKKSATRVLCAKLCAAKLYRISFDYSTLQNLTLSECLRPFYDNICAVFVEG